MTTAWAEAARCRLYPSPVFLSHEKADEKHAAVHCAQCSVWAPCLTEGLVEPTGVRGGLGKVHRARLRRLRRRLEFAPGDPANDADVALLSRAMPVERLGEFLGIGLDELLGRVAVAKQRRQANRRLRRAVAATR